MSFRNGLRIAVTILVLNALGGSPAYALHLDEGRIFKLTGQFYSQTRIRTQNTDAPIALQGGGTHPAGKLGQLIQWRNYAFPVLEGDVGKGLGWSFFDNLSFRFAGRFIYDGAYDFGASQYRRALRRHLVAARNPCPNPLDPNCDLGLGGLEPLAVYQGTKPVEQRDGTTFIGPCGNPANPPFFAPDCQLADPAVRARRLADQEVFNPRDRFTQQYDPWEIYVNIEKRPLFLRIGKQNLAWGESDGQRLLDGNNPLDRLFGLPFDEDIDEQRIPLWMIRGNLQLVDSWGPLSSFGVEGYLVPGVIDTTQNPLPFGNDYPYGPPAGCDAQFIANEAAVENFGGNRTGLRGCVRSNPAANPTPSGGEIKTSLYERLPAKEWKNSRFGVRVLGILFRDYTFSLGAYRSWADIPAPRVHFNDLLFLDPTEAALFLPFLPSNTPPLPTSTVAEITHGQVDVIGGTLSFFQPYLLPGVVRSEVGYFKDEPATVGIANFGNIPLLPELAAGDQIVTDTFVPTADYIRWVIGYDIFQLNVPWISPTNNIVVVAQSFNSYRLTSDRPFRQLAAETFPGTPSKAASEGRFLGGGNQPDGSRTFAPTFQSLGNITFQAFMMHGLLVPRITFVGDIEGWGSVLPNVEYRLRDDLLVRLSYSAIFGRYFAGGFFRDRDQVGMRITWLLS